MDSYNFEKIGKKMPYRVPDAFFSDVENNIIVKARYHWHKRNLLRIVYRTLAVSASLVLVIIVAGQIIQNHKTDYSDIIQAFDNMSDSDQLYLLEMYQDDIFINE